MFGRRLITLAIVSFLVVAAVTLFSGCQKGSEEDRVKKVITDIQAAAEKKDARTIMGYVSKSYDDSQGLKYDNLRGLLLGFFLRYPKITVFINNLQIAVDGASARATFQALLTSRKATGSVSDVVPESLGLYTFEVSLLKESGDWKVMAARWAQVQAE